MTEIQSRMVPGDALLARYLGAGKYTDCLTVDRAGHRRARCRNGEQLCRVEC